ncbi:hypothetical protein WQE_05262 [Paraburkholderia hospita]|uniref:Uncharacterized protein n=1 Tax=Paraburkholderia hospita TaxID=169430 RepID=A0ABN0FTS1_9BURK|nr:hypothetical protein WQE_05262 [Paraburkholderia hospita]
MPLPQPISRGSKSQRRPVCRMNRMPVRRTIIERLAPRITASPWFGRGQKRFDECPKFVVEYGFSHVLFVVETMRRLTGFIESKQPLRSFC